ncbi:MAG: beta-galactosidase, partial [Acutalibacteraceae bacterium]|nr:beta-galactosidase [Acutalibacteraceae bacterium]
MEKTIIPRPEHPEPMMQRENWQNLNGEWLFHTNPIGSAEKVMIEPFATAPYTQKILVPFCPQSKLSGIENKDFMRMVWYKRIITFTEEQLKGRV